MLNRLCGNSPPALAVASLIIICCGWIPRHGEALVPIPCKDNATTTKICCPSPKFSHIPCGGASRGSCQPVHVPNEFVPEIFKLDDRIHWPLRFFTHMCKCEGNFWGADCSECNYGWTGKHCDRPLVVKRKNMKKMHPSEKRLLVKVIDRSLYEPYDQLIFVEQDNVNSDPLGKIEWIHPSVQYGMVFDHRYSSRSTLFNMGKDCSNYGFLDFNHDSIGFLTWHRYFMMVWERQLQKIASKYFGVHNFALPYWDWTGLDRCDVCTDDLMGSEGRQTKEGVHISHGSPFYNWTEFCVEPTQELQCYGCHVAGPGPKRWITRSWNNLDFPTQRDVDWLLNIREFYIPGERNSQKICSFHRALEGRCGRTPDYDERQWSHNRIHNMLDGSMCCSGTSPSDPLFIVHHIQMDRMFDAYLKKFKTPVSVYPKTTRPGHSLSSNLVSWMPLMKHYKMWTDVENLGYTYDSLEFGQH